MNSRLALATLSASSLVLLAGCTVGPDYTPPSISTPPAFASPSASETSADQALKVAQDPAETARWWERLNDPTLTTLIETALARNNDVRLAVARLDESRALLGLSRASELPSVDADAGMERSRPSENTGGPKFQIEEDDLYRAGLGATWELDFFGRVRRGVEAARADLQAAEASIDDARVLVAAGVANAYAELRAAQQRLAVARRAVEVRTQSLELAKARANAGLSADLDVAQAEAEVQLRLASIPGFEATIAQRANQLAVLLGGSSAELLQQLASPGSIPTAPPTIAVGIPADLLTRRPDLRRAERQVAAATARIGVATGDLYPRFSLGGNFAMRAANPGDLYDLDSRAYSFGPSMTWSVFNNGRVRANIDAADARTRQAIISYEQAVLSAIRDAEDSIIGLVKEQSRRAALRRAVDADVRAVELATSLYRSGLTDMSSVLENQRRLYEAEDQLVVSELAVVQNVIASYRALGGGWEPATPTVPEQATPSPAAPQP
jgi:NodT family efflux transporter outer membrane factor (OMF) lipoprotein